MPRFATPEIPYSVSSTGADGAVALSVANAANLNPTTGICCSIWFFPTGTPKAFAAFDKSQSGATDSYFILILADGSPAWYSTINGVARNLSAAGKSKRIIWGQINLLELGYYNGVIEIFLNGERLTEEITGLSGSLGVTTQALRIGSYYSGSSGLNFEGIMYRPRLYSRMPTLAEHRRYWFNRQRNGDMESNYLLLDLAMTEGSGTNIDDASSYDTDATMGAIASWTTRTPSKAPSLITTARPLITAPRPLITTARPLIT